MTRLQEPDANAYDILSLSPDSSTEEIEDAFHYLIDEGGYRIGVPLRAQRHRAAQIRKAYAVLGDPVRRRAYDEALSDRPLWPPPPDKPGAEALAGLAERQPSEPAPTPVGVLSDGADSETEHPVPIAKAVLSELLLAPEEPQSPRTGTEPAATLATRDVTEAEQPAPRAIERPRNVVVSAVDEPTLLPVDVEAPDSRRSVASQALAAATIALGSFALFLSWPNGKPQPSSRAGPEREMGSPSTSATRGPSSLALLRPAPGAAFSKDQTAEQGDSTPQTVTQFFDNRAAVDAAAPQPSAASIAETRAQSFTVDLGPDAPESPSSASPAPQGQVPAGAAAAASVPTPAPPVAQAPVTPAPSVAPATARRPAAPTIAHASAARSAAVGAVRVPAQWLSGGPTDADNRHGRYTGTVVVQFTVGADGRASNCVAARGSGNADLDAMTCRLVEERTRFRPALDSQNRPVVSQAQAIYEWRRRHRHLDLNPFRKPGS